MCACGTMDDDSPPALKYTEAAQTDLLVFRCGEVYLTYEKGNEDWLTAYGEIPAEISLTDGEFARVNADIARVEGGSTFCNGNPEIRKVNSMEKVSQEDMVKTGELEEYDPAANFFYGPRRFASGSDLYCIAYDRGDFYVYENNTCLGVYLTTYEAEAAMGLYDPLDSSIELNELRGASVYVMRCEDTCLAYTRNASIIDDNKWKLLLDGKLENELTGMELADGEMVWVCDADLIRVNGGEYENALMLKTAPDIRNCGYNDFMGAAAVARWEEKGSSAEEGEIRQSGDGEYLILFHNGKYHVYQDNGTQQLPAGVYDSVSEVDSLVK